MKAWRTGSALGKASELRGLKHSGLTHGIQHGQYHLNESGLIDRNREGLPTRKAQMKNTQSCRAGDQLLDTIPNICLPREDITMLCPPKKLQTTEHFEISHGEDRL